MYIHMADKIMLVRIVYNIDILICVYATYVAAPVLPNAHILNMYIHMAD